GGTIGFEMRGAEIFDGTGASVAAAGDLNGDGIDDVAVGAPDAGTPGGAFAQGYTYIVYGRDTGFPPELILQDLDADEGFRIEGATQYDGIGTAIAGGSDLNGDGFEDLVLGAPFQGYDYGCYYCGTYRAGHGAAYVIYGSNGPFEPTLSLGDPGLDNVIQIEGPLDSRMGISVATGGDFNADGRPDIALGAPDGFESGTVGLGAGMVVLGRGPGRCDADLDGDGELTLFDFLAFQNLFDAGDLIADFDGDGRLTLFDFLAFQNAFDAGCP
ncbi:MAG: GC-type dockerin domain-anchored protein, partial [Planctomycetota bacterium]